MADMESLAVVMEEKDGPKLYSCAQGVMFVKRSADPESTKIAKLMRPVGTSLRATGRTWTGPSGGVWAEIDELDGEHASWALVQGPGFGVSGPVLVEVSPDRKLVRLEVVLLDYQRSGVLFESMLPGTTTLAAVKRMVCQKTGLIQGHCCLGKDPPVNHDSGEPISIDYMPALSDEKDLDSLKFQDEGMLFLVYLDDLPKDFKRLRPVKIDLGKKSRSEMLT